MRVTAEAELQAQTELLIVAAAVAVVVALQTVGTVVAAKLSFDI
jgi:hypothetical protein